VLIVIVEVHIDSSVRVFRRSVEITLVDLASLINRNPGSTFIAPVYLSFHSLDVFLHFFVVVIVELLFPAR
jgi:hypothetical protein